MFCLEVIQQQNGTSTEEARVARQPIMPSVEKAIADSSVTVEGDFSVEDQGSVFLFRLLSEEAMAWTRANVLTEPWQWIGQHAFAVDHRYALPLLEGMLEEGFALDN